MTKQLLKRHLLAWVTSHIWFLVQFLLISALFLLYPHLYQADLGLLSYLWLLYAVLSLLFFLGDFYTSYQRSTRLAFLLNAIKNGDSVPDNLPVIGLAEESLLEALTISNQRLQEQVQKQQIQNSQQLDYYTMWIHQIKTPIAAGRLLVDQLPASLEKKLLEQEFIKIQTYSDFVLHYLRMESFHQDLLLEEQSLEDMLQSIIKKYASFFIQKQIQLNLEPINYRFTTDKKWFSVILEQVISNALKYTKDHGQISIRLDGDILLVEDSGIGISKADLGRIFERGFSGFNGRMQNHSSGLGLYLSSEIAKKLGIALKAESSPGKGTTILIDLEQVELDFD
ncbi:sensor histidine kinase [Granulicatella seriolae]|uniref:histidine kinase n=1 Tax=Granulicatella seriolae TaxID=2967226 RepID=A0ABT1WMI9_9LACT|nr:sensor histidine kinase [Granulicatella seriolae]